MDLKEQQVNQEDPDSKVMMENQAEVSKVHLARMDFKDDLDLPVVRVSLDSMVLKENQVCLEDQLKAHPAKMEEKDLPDLLVCLVDKDLKENLVKMQSLIKTLCMILLSLDQKDHQDLKVPLDSLVTPVYLV